jgi:hypothetical protein
MFSSTSVAVVTESLYLEVLVNEDLCRVCLSRKVPVFLTGDATIAEIKIFSAYK